MKGLKHLPPWGIGIIAAFVFAVAAFAFFGFGTGAGTAHAAELPSIAIATGSSNLHPPDSLLVTHTDNNVGSVPSDTVNAPLTGQDNGHNFFGLPIDATYSQAITFLLAIIGTGAVILVTSFYFASEGFRRAATGVGRQLLEYGFTFLLATIAIGRTFEKLRRGMGRVALASVINNGIDWAHSLTRGTKKKDEVQAHAACA